MRSKKWKISIIGRFIALVLLSLLSLSANAYQSCGTQTTTIQHYVCLGFNSSPWNVLQIRKINSNQQWCETPASYPSTTSYNGVCGTSTQYSYYQCSPTEIRRCDNGTATFPACQPGQTRDSSNNCISAPQPITQDCPKDQYRTIAGGSCQAIPDCNTSTTTGGNYFDIASLQCQSSNKPLLICIGTNEKWCPATDDCQPSGSICSDNIANLNANQTAQATITPAKKIEADNSATQAIAASTAAATIKLAADSDAVSKQNSYQAASTQYQANPTDSGAQALSSALNAYQQSSNQATNVGVSSSASNSSAVNASNSAASIQPPTTKPGIAENLAQQAEYWKNEAQRAMQAAGRGTTYIMNNFPIQGTPGDGDNDNDQETDNDADNDGTPNGIDKNDIDTGQNPNFSQTNSFAQSNAQLLVAFSNYSPIQGINQIREMDFTGSGSCPALSLDTGSSWFGTLSTDSHCQIISTHSALIQNMSRVVWVIGAIFLFFSA